MDTLQLREVSLDLLNPDVIETDLGVMPVHDCPEGCGQLLSQVKCTEGCPHHDCEDRQLHFSAGDYWCPLLQIVERRFAHHQEVGIIEAEA